MKKFYLGMDIGTESVGMACTDENYNLLRAKGKDLWTVRLFEEAKDASERRLKRTARRRLARRRRRIEFLQEIFSPYIEDSLFFIRLNNSGFFEKDKDRALHTKYSLFADGDFNDKDFYGEFPTIYHLRKALIDGGRKRDLRLYYLALHHIIKYRGHFLFNGNFSTGAGDVSELFATFNTISEEVFLDNPLNLPVDKAESFVKIASGNEFISDKKRKCIELLNAAGKNGQELIKLLLGASANAAALFGEEYKEQYKNEKICFKDLTDEEFDAKSAAFEDGHFNLLQSARGIYNFVQLKKILGEHKYLSDAMTAVYNKHAYDLSLLKKFVKTNCPDEYFRIFKSANEKANYANYVGYTKPQKTKIKVKKCAPADFYRFIKKIVSDCNPSEESNYILAEIENGAFLPKILNSDNGLIPHQINGVELDAIVANLCRDYPEFAEIEDKLSPAQKIAELFKFKIPYFVGPLNNYHEESGNSWIVKRGSGKITPYNFKDMVDFAESNRKFIARMTNKCTYLHGKDVLPKCSVIYQKYNVLNQLNKWKFNEQPITVELKKQIYNELFLKFKKVTKKSVADWLVKKGLISAEEKKGLTISGFDGEINASMSSYVTLKNILGDYADSHPEVCEDVILLHTLNTDKNIVENCLIEKYGDEPAIKSKIKELKGITSFKEFGRLSRELLCEVSGGKDPVTGTHFTILDLLYETNKNFNEIYFDKQYCFGSEVEKLNGGVDEDGGVDDLYVSPMVRRGIRQALLMTEEYVRAVGREPDKIFIEVARANEEKKRTVSRKNRLLSLYKGLGEDCADYAGILNKLAGVTDSQLRQDRLYLYFAQLGKCAYTGKVISLEELGTDLYDVDHIVPRSIKKDDSLDNKVLVLRAKNAEKSDKYPLEDGFTSCRLLWDMLHKKGLMSDKKYNLLKRTAPLNDDDFRDFVARQLVVTNQTVSAVAELLKKKYKNTKIVYSKAKNVSDFRQKFSIVKCRETNDLHHARDAYLNIAVGNVYDVKFTCAEEYYYRKGDFWREYNLEKLFNKDVQGAWDKDASLPTILKTLAKPSMTVTEYTFIGKGEFYDQTVYSGKKGVAVPRKDCAPYNIKDENGFYKYGGYKSLNIAYFSIVESEGKKGKKIKTIEEVPVLIDYKTGGNEQKLLEYFISRGLKNPQFLIPKLKKMTLLSVNGFYCRIAGITDIRRILHNAVQWFTDNATDLYVKNLVKLVGWDSDGKLSDEEKGKESFVIHTNAEGKVKVCVDREHNLKLYDVISEKLQTKRYSGLRSVKTFSEGLREKRDKFISLSTFEQAKVLLQIVRFMKCNAELSDLSLLNGGTGDKGCGRITIKKDITDVDFSIIHLSPCGLIERRVKI